MNSVAFITFTVLCNYHHYFQTFSITPDRNSGAISNNSHPFLPSGDLYLLPVSMNLPILEIAISGVKQY